MASSTASLPPLSPSPLAQKPQHVESESAQVVPSEPSDPLANIPDLTTKPATSEDDIVESLHLLADSVAQQRQVASNHIIFHPMSLAILALILGLVWQYMYKGSYGDGALIGTTSAGVLMAGLISVRWMSSGYLYEAENVGTFKWLRKGRDADVDAAVDVVGKEDEILLTRFGDEVIGTIIVRGVRHADAVASGGSGSPRKRRQNSLSKNSPVKGVIRGWTVRTKYRGKGIGAGLLEDAVKLCNEKGWTGPEFAPDHAHSVRVLPAVYNGGFTKRDSRAAVSLQKVIAEYGVERKGSKKGRR